MFRRRTSMSEHQFEEALEHVLQEGRLVDGGTAHDDEELRVARWLSAELTPLREVSPLVRQRSWQVVQARIAAREQRAFGQQAGDALSVFMRSLPRRSVWAAVALALAIGVVSPFGPQAVAGAWEKISVFALPAARVAIERLPDGSLIERRVDPVDQLVSLDEAEHQAGFPARLPSYLPEGARFLGARVIVQRAGTPQEWRQISLTWAVGSGTLGLVESRNMPAEAKGMPTNADGTPAQRVQVGSAQGWLQNWSAGPESPGYTVIWEDDAIHYWLSGHLPAEALRRIAESIQ